MKISPLLSTNQGLYTKNKVKSSLNEQTFKGTYEYLETHKTMYDGESFCFWHCDRPGRTPEEAAEKFLEINNLKYAGMEKGGGLYNSKVYLADPMEMVNQSIKDEVSYVLYQKEPDFPRLDGRVSENYFGKDMTNYGKVFAQIKDFYRRYENSARRNIEIYRQQILESNDNVPYAYSQIQYFEAKIPELQKMQKVAQDCIDIYEKGTSLRIAKGKILHEISECRDDVYREHLSNKHNKIKFKNFSEELTEETKKRELLSKKLNLYIGLSDIDSELSQTSSGEHNKMISSLRKELAILDEKIEKLKANVMDYKERVERHPKTLTELNARMSELALKVKGLEKKLVPYYNELKSYYIKKGLMF